MAGNFEKWIDRSPIICPAGKISGDPTKTVASCLLSYNVDSQIDALKHDAGIFEEHRKPFVYKLPKLENRRHRGIHTEIRPALCPPVFTRYQTLINDLKETSYESYWNKLEGRTRDPTAGLPKGMDPLGTTFGTPTPRKVTMKELINPPKTVYEVLWNSQVGHEFYKKTHDDYNPAERIDRGYLKPAYNPDRRYGKRTTYDPRGIWVRCACNWHNSEPATVVHHIQSDVDERTKQKTGKCLTPIKNINSVNTGHRFGKPCNRELYGMEELLKDQDCPPCLFKRDFHTWMKHLNELRIKLKKRNGVNFDLKKFHDSLAYFDKQGTGCIPLQLVYHVCECNQVNFEHNLLEPLLTLGYIMNEHEQVNYTRFVELIDANKSCPLAIKVEDVPPKNQYYLTTTQAAQCDYLFINNSDMPIAGLPSLRYDLDRPLVPQGACKPDLENLGDETTAGALINPCIFMNYGLTHRDFYLPRSPEVIKKLFEKIGYEFPDNTFEQLWKIGCELDQNEMVCVETFYELIKRATPSPQFKKTDEIKC